MVNLKFLEKMKKNQYYFVIVVKHLVNLVEGSDVTFPLPIRFDEEIGLRNLKRKYM